MGIAVCIVVVAAVLAAPILTSTASSISCAWLSSTVPSRSDLPSTYYLDSDGDGFNDWFEVNVAGYNPEIPNRRYIIYYSRRLDQPGLIPYVVDRPVEFFVEKGGVAHENIITLTGEDANASNLEQAIEEVSRESSANDLVFIRISTHGSPSGVEGGVQYAALDEWIDRIESMVTIVTIQACHAEHALTALQDGAYPRVIFAYTSAEFEGTLGANPDYFVAADRDYGNGDGFISLAEVASWIDNNPMWGPDWAELREEGRGFLEAMGYSKMADSSNIAHLIYLTDYTPYDMPPVLQGS